MKKAFAILLPLLFAVCFAVGIYIVSMSATGLALGSSAEDAMLSGSLISVFSGIWLTISIYFYYKKRS